MDVSKQRRLEGEIAKNIWSVIRRMRKRGTTGCSVQTMLQMTPTPKGLFSVTPRQYEEAFRRVAAGFVFIYTEYDQCVTN